MPVPVPTSRCREGPVVRLLISGDHVALEATARLVARSRRQGLTDAELGHLRAYLLS